MTNKQTKRVNCRHCGKPFYPGSGIQRHERACALRPPDADLLDMFQVQGMTMYQIGQKVGVAYRIVRGWLVELGAYEYVPRGPRKERQRQGTTRKRAEEELVLRKDLAHPLAFGFLARCRRPRPGNPALCRGHEACMARLRDGLWILCEVPDVEQVKRLEGRGVDIRAIVARVPA